MNIKYTLTDEEMKAAIRLYIEKKTGFSSTIVAESSIVCDPDCGEYFEMDIK